MRKALAAWDRFWFTSRPTSTAAAVRIGGALLMLAYALSLGRDVPSFFGPQAVLPSQPDFRSSGLKGVWSALGTAPTDGAAYAVFGALVVGALCLLVGYHSRLAAFLVFVAMVSFTRRTPVVFNSGDALLRNLSFYLLLVPGGAALSLDRRRLLRRARRKAGDDQPTEPFWAFPARAVWPLRLMQIQLTVAYLGAVWAKGAGATWRDGTAVAYSLQVDFIRRLPLPGLLSDSLLLSNVLTFGTLATELAIGLLVWSRLARPYVLLVGVAFHLVLDYAFRVGFFSYGMFVLYLSFIPPEAMEAWLSSVRDRLSRRRARPVAHLRAGPDGQGVRAVEDGAPADADAVVAEPSPGVTRR